MAAPATQRSTHCLALLVLFLLSCLAVTLCDNARPSGVEVDVGAKDIGIGIGIGGGGGGIGIGGGGGGIGIGGGGSTPSGSDTPQPCDFENERLYRAYFVIQAFKKTITCDPKGITDTWNGFDLCSNTSYVGYYCDRPPNVTDRTIASVDFNGYHLASDKLRGFVDKLADLALFHANSNDFHDIIPRLAGLQYFYELDLSNNKLKPALFPTQVLGLTNATFIDIRFNKFYGPLPSELFSSFPRVQAIFVNNNNFSGQLPDNLGFSPVNYLSLANNHFTGPIPESIGHACNTLLEVLFLNNELSGCLPYELGLLQNATVIDAGTNMLTGPIPASFACLRKVEQLNLANNLLYGEVPDALCQLATGRLMNLSLSGNYFTWLGPSCWELIQKGRVLHVERNCIPWLPNQRSPEECAWFLHQPKTCPVNYYVPCLVPYHGEAGTDKEEATAAEETSRSAGYRTYSTLHP